MRDNEPRKAKWEEKNVEKSEGNYIQHNKRILLAEHDFIKMEWNLFEWLTSCAFKARARERPIKYETRTRHPNETD